MLVFHFLKKKSQKEQLLHVYNMTLWKATRKKNTTEDTECIHYKV